MMFRTPITQRIELDFLHVIEGNSVPERCMKIICTAGHVGHSDCHPVPSTSIVLAPPSHSSKFILHTPSFRIK